MTTEHATRAPGTLVRLRGREWVVLPSGDDPEIQLLRPLGGTDDDAIGIDRELEGGDLADAVLPPLDPATVGDAVSARLLRDAVRLGFRSAGGPFRSLGRINCEPRTYQLVPLLMALRLEPVRLLIADDVGIGKTIEAALIARELLDRGEIRRLAVLCSPQLCEQWQRELSEKFHIDAVIVRPGTVNALERRIERDVGLGAASIFTHFPFQVISIDYIKGDRRRDDFVRLCPECVIVDEAHGVAASDRVRGAQHQRNSLVKALARNTSRHLIFTTATPHSGDQSAFASLVGLLVPELEKAVADVAYGGGTEERARLARHFVQRRREDIRNYLDDATIFPDRQTRDETYRLTPAYLDLLKNVLAYARQLVAEAAKHGEAQRRFTWWTAIALLRCVGSSPAAAAAALRTRARPLIGASAAEVDTLAAAIVLDLDQSDAAVADDSIPGADQGGPWNQEGADDRSQPGADQGEPWTQEGADDRSQPGADQGEPWTQERDHDRSQAGADRSRLTAMARAADALMGNADPKLTALFPIVRGLLKDGYAPIVFCRYITTARYVADALRAHLTDLSVDVRAVTGDLPPDEREKAVDALGGSSRRVLVATDCLSEGVNLQKSFTAVVHYDLAWNPTRHEQREGRVDRYGQTAKTVRAVLFYGANNRVDGAVLEVLLRKADTIRKTLGVSVPVPEDVNRVLEAIFDRLFTSGSTDYDQLELFADAETPRQQRLAFGAADTGENALDRAWQSAADREQRSRAIFAQHRLRPDEIAPIVHAARAAVGSGAEVGAFVFETFQRLGATVTSRADGALTIDASSVPPAVRARLDWTDLKSITLAFDPAAPNGAIYVPRTHPIVETLGAFVLETALDLPGEAIARRLGVIRTDAVTERTILLLRRARYVIVETRRGSGGQTTRDLLVEEIDLVGFRGGAAAPDWLDDATTLALAADARPIASVPPALRVHWAKEALALLPGLTPVLDERVKRRALELLEQHTRVRSAVRVAGISHEVRPVLPVDLLGCYILMPPPIAP